jgi:WD40 repeat protein
MESPAQSPLWPLATAVVSFEAYKPPADAQVAGFSTADVEMDQEDPHEYILHVAQSGGGGAIAAALSNRSIALYDLEGGASLRSRGSLNGHTSVITDLTFCDDIGGGGGGGAVPHALLSSSEDRTVRCWDARSGREEYRLAHDAAVQSVAVGCGGSLLASASGHAAHFWDLRQRRRVGCYGDGHTDEVTQVAFNGARPTELATGGEDGLVCVYDTRRATAEESLQAVVNANCAVRRVGFFAPGGDGLYVLTGSETLSLWHTGTAQCIADWQDIRERISPARPVNYLIDCHYDSAAQRLFVAAGDWEGAVTVCEVSDAAVTPLQRLGGGGGSSESGAGGHSAMVRSFLVGSSSSSSTGSGSAACILTGGEDARLCAWPTSAGPDGAGAGGAGAAAAVSSSSTSRGGKKSGSGRDSGKESGRGMRPY